MNSHNLLHAKNMLKSPFYVRYECNDHCKVKISDFTCKFLENQTETGRPSLYMPTGRTTSSESDRLQSEGSIYFIFVLLRNSAG